MALWLEGNMGVLKTEEYQLKDSTTQWSRHIIRADTCLCDRDACSREGLDSAKAPGDVLKIEYLSKNGVADRKYLYKPAHA